VKRDIECSGERHHSERGGRKSEGSPTLLGGIGAPASPALRHSIEFEYP